MSCVIRQHDHKASVGFVIVAENHQAAFLGGWLLSGLTTEKNLICYCLHNIWFQSNKKRNSSKTTIFVYYKQIHKHNKEIIYLVLLSATMAMTKDKRRQHVSQLGRLQPYDIA